MPEPIIIAFHENGNIEYTRNSHFSPFSGKGEMQRVTDIKKSPYYEEYHIKWMLGPFAGADHSWNIVRSYFNPDERRAAGIEFSPENDRPWGVLKFRTYEDAVKHEIIMLNKMRQCGVTFYEKAV